MNLVLHFVHVRMYLIAAWLATDFSTTSRITPSLAFRSSGYCVWYNMTAMGFKQFSDTEMANAEPLESLLCSVDLSEDLITARRSQSGAVGEMKAWTTARVQADAKKTGRRLECSWLLAQMRQPGSTLCADFNGATWYRIEALLSVRNFRLRRIIAGCASITSSRYVKRL